MNHFAREGMTRHAIGGHYGQTPLRSLELLGKKKIETYNLHFGSVSRMIRAAAGKLPGHVTTVGFGTTVDPKHG
jgi:propionate CoA-transferase